MHGERDRSRSDPMLPAAAEPSRRRCSDDVPHRSGSPLAARPGGRGEALSDFSERASDLTLWGSGPGWPGTEPPFPAQPGPFTVRVSVRAREGGPGMPVYVGIDVHRKRSQVAVVGKSGEVLVNRNVPNGVEPVLTAIGRVP